MERGTTVRGLVDVSSRPVSRSSKPPPRHRVYPGVSGASSPLGVSASVNLLRCWVPSNPIWSVEGGSAVVISLTTISKMLSAICLDEHDCFVDLGCGIGHVCLLAAAAFGCRCVGVEISQQGVDAGVLFAQRHSLPVCFIRDDIANLTVNDFPIRPTVMYAFDTAFDRSTRSHVSRLFNNLPSLRMVCAMVAVPDTLIWQKKTQVVVKAFGSGKQFTVFVYKRVVVGFPTSPLLTVLQKLDAPTSSDFIPPLPSVPSIAYTSNPVFWADL